MYCAKAFDSVYHSKLWKILEEMGIPDHVTCLLRNPYAGQEAIVRTRHGTMDWFKIGKGVLQGCILSSYFTSVAQSCPTLCDPMDCSTPGFPVHYQLPKLTQAHVNQIGDAIQPSHPLSSPSYEPCRVGSPYLFNLYAEWLLLLLLLLSRFSQCLTLCNPIDGSPLGSSVHGILQARILEWVAISFSNACTHAKSLQ